MFLICQQNDADGPWPIFERLLASHDELAELSGLLEQDIRLAFMIRMGDWARNGRTTLGMCFMPRVQGELSALFDQLLEDTLGYYPDFLIVLNGEWWDQASRTQREVLVFHEALHAGQARDQYGVPKFDRKTGRPVIRLVPHDVEEFTAVVRRYGGWEHGLAEFLAAAGEAPGTAMEANRLS